jgi:hypothetical protein
MICCELVFRIMEEGIRLFGCSGADTGKVFSGKV